MVRDGGPVAHFLACSTSVGPQQLQDLRGDDHLRIQCVLDHFGVFSVCFGQGRGTWTHRGGGVELVCTLRAVFGDSVCNDGGLWMESDEDVGP